MGWAQTPAGWNWAGRPGSLVGLEEEPQELSVRWIQGEEIIAEYTPVLMS